jgi:hypothetical protein
MPNTNPGEYQTYIASLNRTIQLNPHIGIGMGHQRLFKEHESSLERWAVI